MQISFNPSLMMAAALILSPLASRGDTAPAITSQPTNVVVTPGGACQISVGVSGTAPMTYQWLKDGVILPDQTGSSISFASFQFTDCGCYRLVVMNALGMALSLPAAVTVPGAPLLVTGDNTYGELGNGSSVGDTNVPVFATSNVVAVASGNGFSLLIKSDNTLWGVGYNNYGQLGNGTTAGTSVPVFVSSNVVAITAGYAHSLFVKRDGSLWTMGRNLKGGLGNGSSDSSAHPTPVNVANNVVAVAAALDFSLFVKNDGTLWDMGYNSLGQLGIGTSDNNAHPNPINIASGVIMTAAGGNSAFFLKGDGTLWAQGNNGSGQLGDGDTSQQPARSPVNMADNVVTMAAGNYHALYVTSDGTLWSMGDNTYGELGTGSRDSAVHATPINATNNVVAVAAGEHHSVFITGDGTVWGMGYNSSGQLGIGTNNSFQVTPAPMPGLMAASLGPMGDANHTPVVASGPPQIAPLAGHTILAGQPVTFTLNVTSGIGPFTYQWQSNGVNIAGATSGSYTIAAVTNGSAGIYTGFVSNAVGFASSSAALIVVTGGGAGYDRLNGMSLGRGTNALNFLGASNLSYALEYATNLAAPVWIPLATNPAAANGRLVLTNFMTNAPVFYRMRYVPQ